MEDSICHTWIISIFLNTCLPLSFFHNLVDNYGEQKQHEMKELSIPREMMHFVLKKCLSAPNYNALNNLHFALVSMKPKLSDNFQSKPHLNISIAEL